ncbi:MAG: succinate dehydrogenase assembly factor 2 [Pseudomonadota bacterium]
MTDETETRRRRAKFRANHRGTKEMDWILGRYADAHIDEMVGADLSTFEELLSIADPEINEWILDPMTYPQGQFFVLLERIRSFHNISKTH